MMWALVKMSGKWFAYEVEDFSENEEAITNVEHYVLTGNIVVLVDDLEAFMDEFEVVKSEIERVE